MPVSLLEGPFTVADYHRLAELGILHEDDRVELLNGQVIVMGPIGPRHAGCVDALNRLLSRLVGDFGIVRVRNPVVLGHRAEPEPDLAILRPRADWYRGSHPRPNDVLLVVEVADTSLEYDRDVKLPLYAAASIPEVWLVDLDGERIEAYRAPGSEGYGDLVTASRGETLSALHLAGLTLGVDEILG
ncbi:MAG: Uma2 family endonuclease [Gemmatimonadota bacterium]|nr:Uma2 family endonuclease [Gemmatimonadota bacterium]MDH3367973.1 Uma2 family endonuclease [Gemmatimonadota bacterium]MDH3479838.1 Uma2 family endonuclease [Gemmatimonadota bacterium]MDH3570945.1 Uma2 family endonuclease [Gemmatimonadota bacterium]MDH5550738.1 Uma2 family endonuclease [Gemmatimonadota bacterium]